MADPARTAPVQGDWMFTASLQPSTPESAAAGYVGTYMTPARKMQYANNYLRDGRGPSPLCANGRAGHAPTFGDMHAMREGDVVGYVTGVFYDPRQNNLLMTGFVKQERPEALRVFKSMMVGGVPYGVSAGTHYEETDERGVKVPVDESKLFAHVALTPVPDMAEEDAWIHQYTTNPAAITRVMSEELARGAVANAESMAAWGVPRDLQERVLSVLSANISRAAAAGDIIPTDVDRESMAQAPPNPQTSLPVPGSASAPSPAAPAPATDKMDLDPPPASSTPPAPSSTQTPAAPAGGQMTAEQAVAAIVSAITKSKENIEKAFKESAGLQEEKEYRKKEAIEHMLKEAAAKMRELHIDVIDHPTLLDQWTTLRNETRAIDEKIKTMIKEEGTAANNQNASMFQEYERPDTMPERKRQIAQLVTASREGKRQKAAEADLQAQRARVKELEDQLRTKDEQLVKKRKAEEDDTRTQIAKLQGEVERLTKRQTQVGPLGLPPGAMPSFDFMRGFNPLADGRGTPMDLDDPHGGSARRTTPASAFVIPGGAQGNPLEKGPGGMTLRRTETGLVTASGFEMTRDDMTLGQRVAHPMLLNFAIDSSTQGSWQHAGDPTFQRTFDAVCAQVAGGGTSGLAFVHDASSFRGSKGGSEIDRDTLMRSAGLPLK
jgi:hypothetical protein